MLQVAASFLTKNIQILEIGRFLVQVTLGQGKGQKAKDKGQGQVDRVGAEIVDTFPPPKNG